MTGLHSIWLVPQATDAAWLTAIIDELAAAFGQPRFAPHLTLTEEIRCDAADLAREAGVAAAGVETFDASIESIDTGLLFFRCLYARMSMPPPLAGLRAGLAARLGIGGSAGFLPHVSLLYGVGESAEKQAARDRVSSALEGRKIRFDRLCVVASAKEIPVEAWKPRVEIGLS
jgi:hypothetical protein